ncbi:MAG TPA: hypothetical protein VFZ65_21840, partial [Planctomycetota bacterium]|nr:hypothetical protein [Planctomycetota bacterium]
IAARLDVPIETVRTRIKRALQMLREDLDARHGDTKAWALPMLGAGWAGSGPAAVLGVVGAFAAAAVVGAFLIWPHKVAPSPRVGPGSGVAVESGGVDRAARTLPADIEQPDSATRRELVAGESLAQTAAGPSASAPQPGIVGRIVDADSRAPLAGADVAIANRFVRFESKEAEVPAGARVAAESLAACTDVDGRFRVLRSTGTPCELLVRTAGHAPRVFPLAPLLELAASRSHRQPALEIDIGDLALARGQWLSGCVLAADGSTPVANAQISLLTWTERTLSADPIATSDGSGTFVLNQPIAPDAWPRLVLATSEAGVGYQTIVPDCLPSAFRIVLSPVASLGCTVVDEAGAPIAGARLFALPRYLPCDDHGELRVVASSTPWRTSRTDTTDAAGRVVVRGLVCGPGGGGMPISCDLRVYAPGHRGDCRTVELHPGSNEQRFVLPSGEQDTVHGRVLDPDGRPIAGARIGDQTISDVQGSFECAHVELRSGMVRLEVRAEGFAPLQHEEPVAGRAGDLFVTLVLQPAGVVRGIVRDQFGQPVAQARIEGAAGDCSTASDGSFELPGVALGPVHLRAVPPFEYLVFAGPVEVDVEPAQRDAVAITLQRR